MPDTQPGTMDLYSWIVNSGGSWQDAANWQDVTAGHDPATSVPGIDDPVTINGPVTLLSTGYTIIGGGSAASAQLTGVFDLVGTYDIGIFTVTSPPFNPYSEIGTSIGLEGTGSALQANWLNLEYGDFDVGAGATLTVNNLVSVLAPGGDGPGGSGEFFVDAGGVMTAATLLIADNAEFYLGAGSLSVGGSLVIAYGDLEAGDSASLTVGGDLLLGTGNDPQGQGQAEIAGNANVFVAGDVDEVNPYSTIAQIEIFNGGLDIAGTLTLNAVAASGLSADLEDNAVLRAGGLALVNTATTAGLAALLDIDATSLVEIGAAGTGAPGALTIDAGITVAAASATLACDVVNNGLISETAGTLTIDGTLSGSGTITLGANDGVSLFGPDAGSTIAFDGSAAALTIGASLAYGSTSTFLSPPYAVAATLAGFAIGDTIFVDGATLTGTAYTYDGNNVGRLVLYANAVAVETLTLAGNDTNEVFLPIAGPGDVSAVSLLPPPPATPGPIATNQDAYAWVGTSEAWWQSPSNWQDVTAGLNPAPAVPGAENSVTIAGPLGPVYEEINGGGTVASIGVTGLVDLAGAYGIGTLDIGAEQITASTVVDTPANVILGAGSAVQAGALDVVDGALTLTGASLAASGPVTLGTQAGTPTATSGYTSGATGALNLADRAVMTTAGTLAVDYGSISVAGPATSLSIGGDLLLGALGNQPEIIPITDAEPGSLLITDGASVSVAGALDQVLPLNQNNEFVVSDSTLTIGGPLTLDADGTYGITIEDGAMLRAGGLALVNTDDPTAAVTLWVDDTSIAEIGTAGTGALGALTIDPGITVASTTSATIDGNLVDNGLLAEVGILTINGQLSGTGVIDLVPDDGLILLGAAAAGNTIAFGGTGDALTIGQNAHSPMAALLSGFAAGDTLIVDGANLTDAVYSYAGNDTGQLVLYVGGNAFETLTLAGNYTGDTFFVPPGSDMVSTVVLLQNGGGNPGTVADNLDTYTWIGNSGGFWQNPANWEDLTAGLNPANAIPGPGNPVTLTGPTGPDFEVITGGGEPNSVFETGLIELLGTYTTGDFDIGVASSIGTYTQGGVLGDLELGAGATVQADAVNIAYGSLSLSGANVSFVVSSGVTLGAPGVPPPSYPPNPPAAGTLSLAEGAVFTASGDVTVSDGSITAQDPGTDLNIGGDLVLGTTGTAPSAGSLSVTGGALASVAGSVPVLAYSIDVDDVSILEIGTAATAATGALTIDPGHSVNAVTTPVIDANVVDNGAITEAGGALTITGILSGTGSLVIAGGAASNVAAMTGSVQVQLGVDSAMTLDGPASAGSTIDFGGNAALLTIGTAEMAATLAGLADSDVIIVNNARLTSAVYTYAGHDTGSLLLSAGTHDVQTISLAGNYTNATFLLAATAGSGTEVTLLPSTPVTSPVSANADLYSWVGPLIGSWQDAANWQDVTAGLDPASAIPGPLTPVTIAGPTTSSEDVISGGGTAASIGLTGGVALLGTYSTDSLSIGNTTTSIPGTLTVGAGSLIEASTVSINGSLALSGAGASLAASGLVTVDSSDLGSIRTTLSLADGAVMTAASNVFVDTGTISVRDSATSLSIAGTLDLGSSGGVLSVGAGAIVSVGGDLAFTDPDGLALTDEVSVVGQGAQLSVGGTLTLAADGFVGSNGLVEAAGYVAGGAVVRAASLVLDSPPVFPPPHHPIPYTEATNLYIDSTSTVELGSGSTTTGAALTIGSGADADNEGVVSIVAGTLDITGDLVGSGTVEIGNDEGLDLNGRVFGTIAFASPGATLILENNGAETLSGFALGDAIIVNDVSLTNAVYTYLGNDLGSLVLYSGITAATTLALVGNYAEDAFAINGSTISLVEGPAVTAPDSEAVRVGQATPLRGVAVSDANAAVSGITVTLSDSLGLFSANSDGGGTVSGSGTTKLVIAGSIAQVNADLATLAYVLNSANTDTISLTAVDSQGGMSAPVNVDVTLLSGVYQVAAIIDGQTQTISLSYDSTALAIGEVANLTNGLVLNPATEPGDTAPGPFSNLVVPAGYSGSPTISGAGYNTVVIGSLSAPLTLLGGDAPAGQTIIASDTGLDFRSADATNTEVVAGGGTNDISFAGSTGSDQIYLSAGSNSIVAGAGPTTIDGGVDSSTITGGAGPDFFIVEGQDSIDLASGASTVTVLGGADAAVSAGSGPLLFFGGSAASTVAGGAGNVTVYAGTGGGAFTGGAGNNVLVGATDGAAGLPTAGASLTLTGGASASNYLQGDFNGGDVLQSGAATAATLVSEGPGDTIDGGPGATMIVLNSAAAGVDTVNLGSGAATVTVAAQAVGYVTGGSGSLLFVGGLNASTVLGGSGTETIYGNAGGGYFTATSAGANVLVGGAGAVTLVGAAGAYLQGDDEGRGRPDLLIAGAGNETLAAGTGNDTLTGSLTGNDVFSFLYSSPQLQYYEITGFHSGDLLYVPTQADAIAALSSATIVGGSTSVTLGNNTHITLQGYTGPLTAGNFSAPT